MNGLFAVSRERGCKCHVMVVAIDHAQHLLDRLTNQFLSPQAHRRSVFYEMKYLELMIINDHKMVRIAIHPIVCQPTSFAWVTVIQHGK